MTETPPETGFETGPLIGLLLTAVSRNLLLVVACAVTAVVASVAYAMLATPIYRAETLLLPATDGDEAKGALGDILSLVPNGAPTSRRAEAVAILKSRDFTLAFIDELNLMPVLFADQLDDGGWVDGKAPTLQQAFQLFDDIRAVREDLSAGTVTVAIEWTDANRAAEWANRLIEELNAHMRRKAIRTYEATLGYLERELQQTTEIGVRGGIFNLIEENMRRRALANVQIEYAFSVLDTARPPDPDGFVRPNRTLIILAGALLGTILGVLLAALVLVLGGGKRPA